MRRKILRLLLAFLALALLLFALLYGFWAGWQREMSAALSSGEALTVVVFGRQMLLPELRFLVGLLAIFFSLLTVGLGVLVFWLTQSGHGEA
jgi:hypothetical protein